MRAKTGPALHKLSSQVHLDLGAGPHSHWCRSLCFMTNALTYHQSSTCPTSARAAPPYKPLSARSARRRRDCRDSTLEISSRRHQRDRVRRPPTRRTRSNRSTPSSGKCHRRYYGGDDRRPDSEVGFDRGSVSRASGEAGSGAETMSKVAGVTVTPARLPPTHRFRGYRRRRHRKPRSKHV